MKCIKTTVAFGIDFSVLLASSYTPTCQHFCYLLHGFFQVNLSVNGLSEKNGFHGSWQLSLYS